MQQEVTIGQFYFAYDSKDSFIYMTVGLTERHGRFSNMVLVGGHSFALDFEESFVELSEESRELIIGVVRPLIGTRKKNDAELLNAISPTNSFGTDPIFRGHFHIRSMNQLKALLAKHFPSLSNRHQNILLELFETFNPPLFHTAHAPKLSL